MLLKWIHCLKANFNTRKVYNMVSMFEECSSLEELNLSNFSTKNADLSFMFRNCSSLKKLEFKIYKNHYPYRIFDYCVSLDDSYKKVYSSCILF